MVHMRVLGYTDTRSFLRRGRGVGAGTARSRPQARLQTERPGRRLPGFPLVLLRRLRPREIPRPFRDDLPLVARGAPHREVRAVHRQRLHARGSGRVASVGRRARCRASASVVRTRTSVPRASPGFDGSSPLGTVRSGNRFGNTQHGTTAKGLLNRSAASTIARPRPGPGASRRSRNTSASAPNRPGRGRKSPPPPTRAPRRGDGSLVERALEVSNRAVRVGDGGPSATARGRSRLSTRRSPGRRCARGWRGVSGAWR